MEFKDLQEVNKTIRTTNIKGKEYAEVNERIKAFRQIFPEGRIQTEIISNNAGDDGLSVCVIKAYAMNTDGVVLATGHAYEKENSSFINKTSYLENAETSAVGRCLGMLGIGIDTSVASAEEVQNAMLNQKKDDGKITTKTWQYLNKVFDKEQIKEMYKECGITNGKDLMEEYAQKKIEESAMKSGEEFEKRNQPNESGFY